MVSQVGIDEGGDPQTPERYEHALARFSEMNPPDPNTFLREAWPHLDPGQKELVQAMLAPRVGGPPTQPQPTNYAVFNPNARLDPSQVQDRRPGRDTRHPLEQAFNNIQSANADARRAKEKKK